MKSVTRRLTLLLGLLLLATSSAHAVLRVEITRGVGGGLPIAVAPFKIMKGELEVDIARTWCRFLAQRRMLAIKTGAY